MKKRLLFLIMATVMITTLTACGSNGNGAKNNGNTDRDSSIDDSSSANTATEKLVNDNPIQPVKDKTKCAVEYFNQHAYTSDFSFNESQPGGGSYWVYKDYDELRKVTLDDHMTVDDTLTIKLGDGLTEVLKTDYLNYSSSNSLDEYLSPNEDTYLYGITEDRQEIFALLMKNNMTTDELPVKDCIIEDFLTGNEGESCDYMGLHKGDSLDKVIDVIGSPNRALRFSSASYNTYDIKMTYIDAENDRMAYLTVKLYYEGMDSEKTKAVLDKIIVFNTITEDIAH